MSKANDFLRMHTGSEMYYRSLMGYTYTEGVKDLADLFGAYWLIDLIVSYQLHPQINRHDFQVWKLKRLHGDSFNAVCEEGNKKTLVKQFIEYSDFKYDEAEIWIEGKTLLLPSEH